MTRNAHHHRPPSGPRPSPGRRFLGTTIAFALVCAPAISAAGDPGPTLRRNGAATQLMVDGKPFLILGAETFNSTTSDGEALRPVLDRIAAAHANTVLAPVGWDQLEPTEGRLDFTAVDMVVAEARRRDLRVVILWLAAFKNARSTYAPTWVRRDAARFPRAVTAVPDRPSGALATTRAPVLSTFSPALRAADARAFRGLMAHLAATDRDHRVVMVQVENEVGLLGDSRDHSPGAEAAWRAPVPAAVVDLLAAGGLSPAIQEAWRAHGQARAGAWGTMLGARPAVEELFMAWHFARYVEGVAAAGRSVSPLPFYTNDWLGPQPGQMLPGQYPSGGPTAAMIPVWRAAAPTLSFVSPDIYIDDLKPVLAAYARPDNPLFVPEARFRPGDLFFALGRHASIGQATFGIDNIRPGSQLEATYGLLSPMAPAIAAAQAEGRIAGIMVDGEESQTIDLDGCTLTIRSADAFWRRQRLDAGQQPPPPPHPPPSEVTGYPVPPDQRAFGLAIAMGGGRFVFAGQGFIADVTRAGRPVEIDRVTAGRFVAGAWSPGRWLNGDEYGQIVPRDRVGATEVRLLTPCW